MSHKLIDTSDILDDARKNRVRNEGVANILMTLSRINKINAIYERNLGKNALEFINALLEAFEISYEVPEDELARIPKTGPFILVSNHPYGGLDALLLLKLVLQQRPDFKITGNFIVNNAQPLANQILAAEPWDLTTETEASTHLNNGGCLGIFPAGEVSSYNISSNGVTDKPWLTNILRFIRKAEVPVVPVYFQGNNSMLFYLLDYIHPRLRQFKLPSELLNKKNRVIRVRIGNAISAKDQKDLSDLSRYGRYLRARTYLLGTALEVKKFFIPRFTRATKEEKIIDPVPHEVVKKEVEYLLQNHLLFTSGNFSLVCAPSAQMPNMMTEIGRLREVTFRGVGEGTNRSIDIDEYDLYYHQLFIWDNINEKIVGAYRVGKGREIIENYGIEGFYLQSLFKIDTKLSPVLTESIELGRSFIVEEYQRQPMSLFLLWKGILYFLLKHPEYRYLIGPVSISGLFSELSKHTIIEYIKRNHYNNDIARYIKSRCQFQVPETTIDTDIIVENTADIKKLDKLIEEVEIEKYRMPVLLKKYLSLNGKIVGFNVDPLFNNCLDGLLILDLFDVPAETISSLSKELKDESILKRFYGCTDDSPIAKM